MLKTTLLFLSLISFDASACASNLVAPGQWLEWLLTAPDSADRADDLLEARSVLRAHLEKESATLTRSGRNLDLLALHPGVVSHLPRFLEFLEARPELRDRGPAAVLAAFREFLGTVRLSRAIVINDEELAQIRRQGLVPNFVRTGRGTERDMYFWLARTGVEHAVHLHMSHAGAKISPFLSYSQQAELARLVAIVPPDKSRLRYTWAVELDVLDVVYVSGRTGMIEEALAFDFVPSHRIERLAETQAESYHVSIADMMEDRRWMGYSGGDSRIPRADQPTTERTPRKNSGKDVP